MKVPSYRIFQRIKENGLQLSGVKNLVNERDLPRKATPEPPTIQ
jgi:hypothetical protein